MSCFVWIGQCNVDIMEDAIQAHMAHIPLGTRMWRGPGSAGTLRDYPVQYIMFALHCAPLQPYADNGILQLVETNVGSKPQARS